MPMEHDLLRRKALMIARKIDLVLDVGANEGQFAQMLRTRLGYPHRIVSFEPLKDAYARLNRAAALDNNWDCYNMAIGESRQTAVINISANSQSSSLLPVSESAVAIEPGIGYVGQQQVTVDTLDEMLPKISKPDDSIYLKVDTQGYELNVLRGALEVLDRFKLIQLEAAFFPAYKEEPLVGELINFMYQRGYRIISIEPGWTNNQNGEMLEADFIFAKS